MKTNTGYKLDGTFVFEKFAKFGIKSTTQGELTAFGPNSSSEQEGGGSIPFGLDGSITTLPLYHVLKWAYAGGSPGVASTRALALGLDNNCFRTATYNGDKSLFPDWPNRTMAITMTTQVIRPYLLNGQTFRVSRYFGGQSLLMASNCIYAVLYRTACVDDTGTTARQIVVGYAYTTSGTVLLNYDTGVFYSKTHPCHYVRIAPSVTGEGATFNVDTQSSYRSRLPD